MVSSSRGLITLYLCFGANYRLHYQSSVIRSITAEKAQSVHTVYPANMKHLNNICTMLEQRRRRWADFVQMLYKCFVFDVYISYYIMFRFPNYTGDTDVAFLIVIMSNRYACVCLSLTLHAIKLFVFIFYTLSTLHGIKLFILVIYTVHNYVSMCMPRLTLHVLNYLYWSYTVAQSWATLNAK